MNCLKIFHIWQQICFHNGKNTPYYVAQSGFLLKCTRQCRVAHDKHWTKKIVVWHTTSLSCATWQVSWHIYPNENFVVCHKTSLSCGTRHVSWHIFPNENFVVCHTTYLMTHLEGKNTCVVCILVYYIAHECFLSDVFKIFQFLMTSSNVGR